MTLGIGIVGTGNMGQEHIRRLAGVPGAAVVAVSDVNAEQAKRVGEGARPRPLAAGKPVLCEKPLAPTVEECLRVLDAETALSRRLVQVGFMRRYDDGFRALKQT